MISSRVALLFKHLPNKYPHNLARDHTHVLNRLMQLWDTPQFAAYMHDLVMNKRDDRQGFSVNVMAELIFLDELHSVCEIKGYKLPEFEDPWEAIPLPNASPRSLMQAIERGQLNLVEIYFNAGVKIDYMFEGRQTPLIISSISGQQALARYLLNKGADINAADSGKYTALHWAAFYGHLGLMQDLCNAGANINAEQNSGDTPLSLAVTRGRLDAAKLLLERRADPNIASNHGSPLAIARSRANPEMMALLRQFGGY